MTEKLVLCTTSNIKEAQNIAKLLVEEKLAACVNILPGIQSIYIWENKIHNDNECLMLIKTTLKALPSLKIKIQEIHSYSIPEIIAIDITEGSEKYLNWVKQNVKN